jgi:hypothetical protein
VCIPVFTEWECSAVLVQLSEEEEEEEEEEDTLQKMSLIKRAGNETLEVCAAVLIKE